MNATPTLPALLESYFTQRLMAQRKPVHIRLPLTGTHSVYS